MPELPLRDIHLPNSISWWPLAPGWWLAISLILLLIIAVIVLIVRECLKVTLKKQATEVLNKIELTFQTTGNATQCLAELSVFLRRVSLSHNPDKIAGLTGPAWLKLLAETFKEPKFNQEIGQILVTAPYQEHVKSEDVTQLLQLCRKGVKRL